MAENLSDESKIILQGFEKHLMGTANTLEDLIQSSSSANDSILYGMKALSLYIASLEDRIKAIGFNCKALVHNSNRLELWERLFPLRDWATNQEISGFPETVADVWELSEAELDMLLIKLDKLPLGGINDKRRFLREAIGLSRDISPPK
ncbi:hypothetical protein BKA66DRAFT_613062 [Pyrenochaeta sp. MPI-SDFR-AT-0127]|nr:hypothetical protein BKA66DRAFT_613062 [Pyrenochaeta sp. MPI-SDFR-AT-0127]